MTRLCALIVVAAIASSARGQPAASDAARAPERGQASDTRAALRALVEEGQPDGPDVWPLYWELVQGDLGVRGPDCAPTTEAGVALMAFMRMGGLSAPCDSSECAEARRAFEPLRPLLGKLDEAARAPACRIRYEALQRADACEAGPAEAPMLFWKLPYLRPLRAMGRLNEFALRVDAERGDWESAAGRVRVGVALARHLSLGATLVDRLVAIESARRLLRELRWAAVEHQPPAAACVNLLEALGSEAWPERRLRRSLRGERLLERELVLWLYGAPGPLRVRPDPARFGTFVGADGDREPPDDLCDVETTLRNVDRLFALCQELWSVRIVAAQDDPTRGGLTDKANGLVRSDRLLRIVVPALNEV